MKYFCAILLTFLFCITAYGEIWFVPDSLPDIQTAVDTASPGDTVMVTRSYQNAGGISITGKKIVLLGGGYTKNPGSHNFLTGEAIYSSDNSVPLLFLEDADSTVIKGFLFDRADTENGGGLVLRSSEGVLFEGIHIRGNILQLESSYLTQNKTVHYLVGNDAPQAVLLNQSELFCTNTIWRDMEIVSLLSLKTGSSFNAQNIAVYNNDCTEHLIDISSSFIDMEFSTFHNNNFAAAWSAGSSSINISNSILSHAPTDDPVQFAIHYSSLPSPYPGIGNLAVDPKIDTAGIYPVLLDDSPCISAADPDTTGILRYDLAGNQRPDPVWAPPDMGAYESPRHVPRNTGTRHWIDTDGDDVWGNGTYELPFAGVQTAVDNALPGDTLLVQPGLYRGKTVIENKPLIIASNYILDMDTSAISSTVLLGDSSTFSPVIAVRNTDSLLIAGLTLKEGSGYFVYNDYTFGGGFFSDNSTCRLDHVIFNNNRAAFSGGGLYAIRSNIEMDHTLFKNNSAYLGGAMGFSDSRANLSNISISNNIASSGGGIYAENQSDLVIFYADISTNYAHADSLHTYLTKPAPVSQYGGGLYTTNSDVRIHNTLLSNNHARNKGAAIAFRGGTFDIIQSTIADNQSFADSSGVLYFYQQSDVSTILNSIVWNPDEIQIECKESNLAVSYTNLLDDIGGSILDDLTDISSVSVINTDPLFETAYESTASSSVDAGIAEYAYGGYYLVNYSAHEYSGSAPDLGYLGAFPAIRFEREAVPASVTLFTQTGNDLRIWPNPFNPQTTIHFQLSESGEVRLELYNIRGQHVRTILDKYLHKGSHIIALHAGDLPAGLYLCRLRNPGRVLSTEKILLVK